MMMLTNQEREGPPLRGEQMAALEWHCFSLRCRAHSIRSGLHYCQF